MTAGLGAGLLAGLPAGLGVGLAAGLAAGLISGLSWRALRTKTVPNEGIHRAAWSALYTALGVGLFFGLLVGLFFGPLAGLGSGLGFGLLAGLGSGGHTCFQHVVLRLWLVRNDTAPWRYADFLDYAAERIFLRKVGGGYTFIHRLLQDYFAARQTELSHEAHPETVKQSQSAPS